MTQLWLRRQLPRLNSDSTHVPKFRCWLNSDSTQEEKIVTDWLIWVRVESNCWLNSWVEHNPGHNITAETALRKILTPKIRVFLHCQRVVWECQICYVLMDFSTLRKQVLLLKLGSSTPIIHVELNYSGSITPNSAFIYPPMQVSSPLHGVLLPVISCSSYTVFLGCRCTQKKKRCEIHSEKFWPRKSGYFYTAIG